MSWILLTNDDGADSPALVPFAKALGDLGDVRVVVPDRERSWIGKAITRFDPVRHRIVERDGVQLHAVDGFPADAVQIGAGPLFDDEPPRLVVSGVNVGFNFGAGYSIGSGTVGAAFEGWEMGIDSIAVSTQGGPTWGEWKLHAATPEAAPMWERVTSLAATVVKEISVSSLFDHGDIVSVNLPAEATPDTPWRIAPIARTRYGALYSRSGEVFTHDYWGDIEELGSMDDTDVQLARDGFVAITPIDVPGSREVPAAVRSALERG